MIDPSKLLFYEVQGFKVQGAGMTTSTLYIGQSLIRAIHLMAESKSEYLSLKLVLKGEHAAADF